MSKYILKRLLLMIVVIAGVILIVFGICRMAPGDPVQSILGTGYTQEQYDTLEAALGLDKPVHIQLLNYYKGLITRFDLGISYRTRVSVTSEILARLPTTFLLGAMGLLITICVGIPFGVLSATKQYSFLDYLTTVISLIFSSMPNFWLALMLMLIFSANLGWLPASGLDSWKGWIMPAVSIGMGTVAIITRLTRSSMLEVIRQDYIRTARAKGLPEGKVIRKHALRNAIIPVITMIGVQLGMIVGGSVVVESIFSIPGIGTYLMTAINNRDYNAIQGCVVVLSLSICVMNLIVDIIYGFVDPRIKAQYSSGKKPRRKTGKEGAK